LTTDRRGAARRWAAANRTILGNAGALAGTTLITSALGFAYWGLAARMFPAEAVGVAAALLSAMILLASLSVLGLETLLLGELRRDPRAARSLFSSAALGAATTSAVVGLSLALILPYISTELGRVRESIGGVALFATGVCVTALSLVLDNALVGLLRGGLQLLRNAVQAVGKLGLLAVAGLALAAESETVIVGAWVIATLASLGVAAALPRLLAPSDEGWRPRWSVLLEVKGTALRHHALNVVIQAPFLLMPLVAAVQVSAVVAGYFYAAFMTATFLFILPLSLTTALYALSNPERTIVTTTLRHTFGFSVVIATLGAGTLVLCAPFILRMFGAAYEDGATSSLRVLALAVFPLIVKNHYVTINRVRRRMGRTALFFTVMGAIEIAAASIGAAMNGLLGLSVAWVLAVCFEAIFMLPTVIGALRSGTPDLSPTLPDLQVESARLS
jgi:O-antigen/teichoic acid export membrane protein